MGALTLRALNRTTLHRQGLLERHTGSVAEVVGRLAGLQAQHADQPYIALWSRRADHSIADLEAALADRSVVKATVMRTTLHLVDARDYRALDTLAAEPRLATWRPSAGRAGLDLLELGAEVREFCSEPRSVAEIEEHLAASHGRVDAVKAIPSGVRNAWFRLASSAGGLVHVPPSGMWHSHAKPRYLAADVWLGPGRHPDHAAALDVAVRRYLAAYGPASLDDLVRWAGQRRVPPVRQALERLGEELVHLTGPDGGELFDLSGLKVLEDGAAPARFLSRWDSGIIGYSARDRILPPEHTAAVAKKNGDFLPTFLLDGFVAGLWSVEVSAGRAVLRLQPFGTPSKAQRSELVDEAERLVRFVEPGATEHVVAWGPDA
jgi:Winged helix DNA-binding domain